MFRYCTDKSEKTATFFQRSPFVRASASINLLNHENNQFLPSRILKQQVIQPNNVQKITRNPLK